MRYNILGFDQLKAFELGLNLDELMILRHLHDFTSSGRMDTTIHDGKMYYWVKYDKFVEDLPILGMKKTRVMEIFNNNLSEKPIDWESRYNSMSESSKKRAKSFKHIGVLKSFTKKDKYGTYSYFTFTEKFYNLIPDITDNDGDINKKAAPTLIETTNKNNKPNKSINQNNKNYNHKNKNGIKLAKSKVKVGDNIVDPNSLDDETIEKLSKDKWNW